MTGVFSIYSPCKHYDFNGFQKVHYTQKEQSAMNTGFAESLREYKKRLRRSNLDVEKKRDYTRAIDDVAQLDKRLFEEQGTYLGKFTAHGPDHSARVMEYILEFSDLLKESDSALSPKEFFVLGLTVYLHDLGMTVPLPPKVKRKCKMKLRNGMQGGIAMQMLLRKL